MGMQHSCDYDRQLSSDNVEAINRRMAQGISVIEAISF
jgi:uncharacterized protein YoaH (UPF0181 family)